MKGFFKWRGSGVKAFSLIEMLVVIGIMGVILVISVPAFTSLMTSNSLTQGGQILADQVNLARQMASARNQAVEIRLIRLGGNSVKGYQAVQLWGTDAAGANKAVSRLILLPRNIVVSEDKTKLSSALEHSSAGTMPPSAGSVGEAPYVAFQIRPTGVVTPPIPMDDFYFTVVMSQYADATVLPDNYVTVQINPQTGTALIYRP